MDNLARLLGPAPSEDPEAFAKRLATERLRISEILVDIRNFVPKGTKASPRKRKDPLDLSPEDTLAAMKEMGISSVEELIAKIKEIKSGQSGADKDN